MGHLQAQLQPGGARARQVEAPGTHVEGHKEVLGFCLPEPAQDAALPAGWAPTLTPGPAYQAQRPPRATTTLREGALPSVLRRWDTWKRAREGARRGGRPLPRTRRPLPPPLAPVPAVSHQASQRYTPSPVFSFVNFSSVQSLSRVRLFATPWTAAYQAPPSMGFSRQEYWNGAPP